MKFLGVLAFIGLASAGKDATAIKKNFQTNIDERNQQIFKKCMDRANEGALQYAKENKISGLNRFLLTASSLDDIESKSEYAEMKTAVNNQIEDLQSELDKHGYGWITGIDKNLKWLKVANEAVKACKKNFPEKTGWKASMREICVKSAWALIPGGVNGKQAKTSVIKQAERKLRNEIVQRVSCPPKNEKCSVEQRLNSGFRRQFQSSLQTCLKKNKN